MHGFIYHKYLYDEIVDLNGINNVLPGYHVETRGSIQKNYNPSSYSIMTLGEALSKLSNSGQTRNKRSFFNIKLPFMSTSSTDETVTEETTGTSGISTTQTNCVTVKKVGDVTTTRTNAVTVKETSVVSPADVSGVSTDASTAGVVSTDAATTSVVSTEIVNDDGYFNTMRTNVMHIVSIGQEVENSMVVAAPYLPMVFKVAVYLIPGISTYQVLTLSVNVATITAQALVHYAEGESLTEVAFEAGGQIAYSALVRTYTCM